MNSPYAKEIASLIYDWQGRKSAEAKEIEGKIADTDKKIQNFLNAISMGVVTESTKSVLLRLEGEKKTLETKLSKEKIRNPRYTKEEILTAMGTLCRKGLKDKKAIASLIHRSVKRAKVEESGDVVVTMDVFGPSKDAKNPKEEPCRVRMIPTSFRH